MLATWLGNSDNSLMDNTVTGGSYPSIYTSEMISYLYKNHKPQNFEIPKNIVKEYIDLNSLLESEELFVDKQNGTPFYYINGTQPVKTKNQNKIKINDTSIELNGNEVTINLSIENASKIILERAFNGNIKTIYNKSIL